MSCSAVSPSFLYHIFYLLQISLFLSANRQNNNRQHPNPHPSKKKKRGIASLRLYSSWNKARVFSSHCCCNAPLLPWWQGRVDCMLWYALSRNLWMCRSIIAILYLIGHFSLPHLAEVSSPRSVISKVIEAIMFKLSICFYFLDGHWISFT